MYIDFYTDQLFGNNTNQLKSAQSRHLNSKYPLGQKTYIQAASDHAREQNLFAHLQTLLDGKKLDDALLERLETLLNGKKLDNALLERLDQIMTECCTLGERKCQRTRPEWWTLEVNRLRIW
jgi:chorismate mutase